MLYRCQCSMSHRSSLVSIQLCLWWYFHLPSAVHLSFPTYLFLVFLVAVFSMWPWVWDMQRQSWVMTRDTVIVYKNFLFYSTRYCYLLTISMSVGHHDLDHVLWLEMGIEPTAYSSGSVRFDQSDKTWSLCPTAIETLSIGNCRPTQLCRVRSFCILDCTNWMNLFNTTCHGVL